MGDDGLTGGHALLLYCGVCCGDRQGAISPFFVSPASVEVAILFVLDMNVLSAFLCHRWYRCSVALGGPVTGNVGGMCEEVFD